MISIKTVLVALCVSLGVSRGDVLSDVDRVLEVGTYFLNYVRSNIDVKTYLRPTNFVRENSSYSFLSLP